MKKQFSYFGVALTVMCLPALAMGATLFSDNMSNGAAWTVNAFNGADASATFGYDYGTLAGIPAPPGGGDTIGLRLDGNTAADANPEGGITVTPTGLSFSGNYTFSFDVWIQWHSGGGGTTEYAGGGVGYDGTDKNGDLGTGSGGYLQLVGDGSSTRDYRMYKTPASSSSPAGSTIRP